MPASHPALTALRLSVLLVLFLYLLLAIGYNLATPIFEAPDENHHYFTAQAIAESGSLPSTWADPGRQMGQEAAQPPLYYLLAASLIRIGGGNVPALCHPPACPLDQLWVNPHARLGDASSPSNINRFVHPPNEFELSYAQTVRLVRLLSTLFGIGTLLLVYHTARLICPDQPDYAVMAMAVVAFCPQFAFHHGAVTNDSLIILLASAGIFQLLSLYHHPLTYFRTILLGITIGCAILTKMAGLLLLGYAILFLFWLGWRRTIRGSLSAVMIVGGVAILLSGWMFWRNFALYGDLTATNQFVRLAGGDRHYTIWQVLAETPSIWSSFFALFGWFNVRPPDWVQGLWTGLTLLSLLGITYQATRSLAALAFTGVTGWLVLWVGLVYAGIFQFLLRTPAAQGRLLFPALIPLALGLVAGWQLLPFLHKTRWQWALPLLALISSVYCVTVTLPTAYAWMKPVEMPATATPLYANIGQGVVLQAVEWQATTLYPEQSAEITLYWQASVPVVTAPELEISLLGRNGQLVGKWQGYHGAGRHPATFWEVGKTMVETLSIPISANADAPAQVTARLALVGETISVEIGQIKIASPTQFAPAENPLAQLGGEIQLLEAKLVRDGSLVTLSVLWHVLAPPLRNYTTFVHLGDPTQPPLANGDAPPRDYPTHWWATGERIMDGYQLELPASLPPGRYPVWLGMYQAEDGSRLPLTSNNIRQPHDAYLVGWVEVSR